MKKEENTNYGNMLLARLKSELAETECEKLATLVGRVVEDHQREIRDLKKEGERLRRATPQLSGVKDA